MTTRTRSIALALAPVVLVLLASCGGGGDSDQNARLSEKTGTTPSTAPERVATGSTGAKKQSGDTAKARREARAKARKAEPKPRTKAGIEALKRQAEEKKAAKIKKQGKKGKGGNSSPTTTNPSKPPPSPQPGGTPQQVLGNKARRVCQNLGLGALAKRFNVAATPEAVATAYAQTYPETFRTAVHDGCVSAFSR